MIVASGDGHSFFHKIRRKFGERGLAGTLHYSAMRLVDVCQEALFDLRHNVDTAGVTLPAASGGEGYKGSLPNLVRASLERLPVRYEDFTFIDFGSGKGRTLLVAARFPFRGIIGVEFCEELNRIAQENIKRYRGRRRCSDARSVCADAREFPIPDGPLVVYLFNPFREPVLRAVVENLRGSLLRNPRPLLLVYLRPLWAGALEESGFLEKIGHHRSAFIENYDFLIYRSTIEYTTTAAL